MWRLVFVLVMFPVLLVAQDTTLSFRRSLDIHYDNDVMSQEDRYYSQGIRIGMLFRAEKKNPLGVVLARLPGSRDEYYGVSINQRCYTPTSVREDKILAGDRPFAGLIYIGLTRSSSSYARNLRLIAELDVGGVGRCAACEQAQNEIHRLFRNDLPHGWQNQVRNGLMLDYNVRLEKGLLNSPLFDVTAFGSVEAGTIFNNAGTGMMVRIGLLEPYFFPPGYTKQVRLWLSGQAGVYGIAYNGTLQGGLLSRECIYTIPPEDVSRLVVRANGGVVLAWKRIRLEYTKVQITREFRSGFGHGWGHCNITVYF